MFCCFFFLKKFQSCAKHIWISDHNRRDGGERAGREREGGRDHSTSQEKKGTATLLFGNHKQKMHSSGLKRLNQTPTPVYTGIYSGASRRTHASTRTPRAHPRTPTHTQTETDNKSNKKKRNQTLKTLQKKWNTSSVRINKTSIKQGTSFEFITVEKERRHTESQRKTRPEPLARTFHPEKR